MNTDESIYHKVGLNRSITLWLHNLLQIILGFIIYISTDCCDECVYNSWVFLIVFFLYELLGLCIVFSPLQFSSVYISQSVFNSYSIGQKYKNKQWIKVRGRHIHEL